MHCTQCGEMVPEGALFCARCGRRIETAPAPTVGIQIPQETTLYAPASIGKRCANMIIDGIALNIIIIILFIPLFLFPSLLENMHPYWGVLIGIIPMVGYYSFFESIWQKTPAKYITKTKVVTLTGEKPTFGQILGRSFARIIPFENLSFVFASYPRGWHDKLSGTIVVPETYTAEDVRKINLEKVRHLPKSGLTIFFLILAILFFLLSIFGILAGIVVSSLASSRMLARDASIKSSISTIGISAELYRDSHNDSYSYAEDCESGLFAESEEARQATERIRAFTDKIRCVAQDKSFAVSASLEKEGSYCVDSLGTKESAVAVSDGTTASCVPEVTLGSSWQEFSSAQDGLSILFPGIPRRSTNSGTTSKGVSFTQTSYLLDLGQTFYMVSRFSSVEKIDVSNPDTLLAAEAGAFVEELGGTLTTLGYLDQAGYRALSFFTETPEMTITGRVILVGETSYLLAAGSSLGISEDADPDKFLNSFKPR